MSSKAPNEECLNCFYFELCGADKFNGFDLDNKNCPNYERGARETAEFMKTLKPDTKIIML